MLGTGAPGRDFWKSEPLAWIRRRSASEGKARVKPTLLSVTGRQWGPAGARHFRALPDGENKLKPTGAVPCSPGRWRGLIRSREGGGGGVVMLNTQNRDPQADRTPRHRGEEAESDVKTKIPHLRKSQRQQVLRSTGRPPRGQDLTSGSYETRLTDVGRARTILKQDNAGGLTLPSNETAQLRSGRDMQVRAGEPPVQTRAVTLTGNGVLPRLPRQPTGAGTTRRPRANDGAEALPQIQKQ